MSFKGKHHTKETKGKMNKAISKAMMGNIPWNKGIPCSEETKDKISEANTGKCLSEEHKEKIGESNTREKHGNWKGGFKKVNGYIYFNVPKRSRFSCMADKRGYVKLSRLTMAGYLGRPLTDEEVVHHIDEDKTNNKKGNLRLFESHGKHMSLHHKLNKK